MKIDSLTRPFAPEQIRQRPGQQGKAVSYVDVSSVIERLNEAFEHRWSFDVLQHEIQETEVIVVARLTADGITKSAFGGSTITTDRQGQIVSIADDLKAAASDALKKSASLLGIGLDIYAGMQNVQSEAAGAPTGHGMPSNRSHVVGTSPQRGPAAVAPDPADRITDRQLAAIQGACRRRNMSRTELADLIADRTGKNGPQFLPKGEASDLLSELNYLNGGVQP